MSVRRIGVLLKKELIDNSKSYFFVFAVVAPLSYTLLVNLVFGSLFSQKPRLGIVSHGDSQIVGSLQQIESIHLNLYAFENELKDAVAGGVRDVGVILPENFDSTIREGQPVKLTAYIWGESQLNNRAIVSAVLLHQIRDLSGRSAPVEIVPVSVGDEENIPWKDRFLPVVILMAIFISGFAIPSSSLVGEKEKGTLGAILITPVTQSDIFISKGLLGILVSMVMGTVTLFLNQAVTGRLGLILFLLFLGSVMACCLGLLLGAFIGSIATLYSVIKSLGLIIYGPGIIAVFPGIPGWIGKIFPTYYILNPIMQISRHGGTWATVNHDVFISIGIIILLLATVGGVARKTRQQEAT
jgi:ABC-2 type transport system permease protein